MQYLDVTSDFSFLIMCLWTILFSMDDRIKPKSPLTLTLVEPKVIAFATKIEPSLPISHQDNPKSDNRKKNKKIEV